METLVLLLLLWAFLLSISNNCLGKNLISSTQFLKDGDTIISKGGTFEMGFFSPTNSSNRYVGIWYKKIPVHTVVWVANRDAPLAADTSSSSTVLKITLGGQLALLGDKGQAVWSVNTSRSVRNPVAELLDSGNLVVRDAEDENPENFLWQSFDYPTDIFLPGMKVGWNLQTGHEVFLTAWKGENDPASGQYTMHLDPTGYPQYTLKNRTTEIFSSGPWNGLRFSVAPIEQSNTNLPYGLVRNKKEVYIWYNTSLYLGIYRFHLTSNGILKLWVWEDEIKQWVSFYSEPANICGTYGLCGGNGVCNIHHEYNHSCGCLANFLRNNNATERLSVGCHRRKPLNCHNNGSSSDGFFKYSGIKLPDTKHSWYNESMSLQECERVCLSNCSCMAYSTLNISNGGSGCLMWYADLVDMTTIRDGQDIYIRLAATEIPGLTPEPHHLSSLGRKIKILVLCLSMLVFIVLVGVSLFLYFSKSKGKEQMLKQELEVPVFDWSVISRATNNFSDMNKLGQGGFGAVYKGELDGGEEIAVKRLSKNSRQGLEEFMNEVIFIAKLQHRNLVKLLGCCMSEEEKMLIYEYMPNKSLDFFIFDQTKKKLLDWSKRFNIINGVARGLLYLHQDSRLRIIHRDLKASNVLLDTDLNSKISDFGLARSIVENATGDNTNRVAGTHGYISPEYATHGIFSVKSDVFSFGVLVLEIVSGKRNNKFSNEDQYETLPGHAWKLYKEGESLTLVDEHISDSYDVAQVLRSIHVGLLCVQQSPKNRPNMSSVVQMLVNDAALPQPKEPGFFAGRRAATIEISQPLTLSVAMEPLSLILLLAFLLSIPNICLGKDLITKTQFLRDGETMGSEGGTFVLGFFSPTNSLNHYIGIWYRQDPVKTVVWVANRDAPLADTSSAVLKITLGGQLSLLGDKGQAVWSANTSRSVQNPVAELLDSGNLVVRDADDENPENLLWQSFDYPTDHWLSGMKLGWNLQTGHEVFFTSWKGENDPASGQYTLHLDPTGYPQLSLRNRTTEIFNSGPWNGLRFSVAPVDQSNTNVGPYGLVRNKNEVYVWYNTSVYSGLFRFLVTSNGIIKTWVWEDEIKQWVSFFSEPADICGKHGLCGGNGVCNIHNEYYHSCGCLAKFLPNNNATESLSLGCHRRKSLNCHNNGSSLDKFFKYSGIKLPDTKHSWNNESMSLQECERVCLRNCSCMAYSTLNISKGGSGCLIWYDDLVDMRTLQDGQDIYIRLAATEIPGLLTPEPRHSSSLGRKIKIFVLCLSMLVVIVLAGVSLYLYFCKSKRKEQKLNQELELPVFDRSTISRATNNFSEMNKLGQGGFGDVYKGTLDGGEEIAVKRLSKNSTQGLEEFMNEVICIAKLQHRNLVKLLGCCISGEEKMLIYEYMPNKSLDFFIFDQTRKRLLDWPKRFNIINGIARGLLYLHQDSRLRIIHRDLKTSNVLLDTDLNPKISDFGLARSVLGNATGDNTKRVAGTRGYMSPEYAGHGIFSVKSDVFSFGVSVLEIVSGRRNSEFINEDKYVALAEHAWKLHREGKSIVLVDEQITGSYDVAQVLRSIHVALLCVQQSPEDRPDMCSVVQMLVNDFALPQAKEPGFFFGKEYSSGTHAKGSQNEATITTLNPR
ncbi:uncharacterized protein LOC116023718 [Ipomoea triloba]|uniref:uncharacterized protein LOC116023718 n=1 Tax=Ipomoea triloba TaxID=35885 RepID=UPI00125DCB35|nr:uncharacterized protein LOC116023718 [Ipomoea triloba]